MNKPNHERCEIHRSSCEPGAAELDAAIGGNAHYFQILSNIFKAQSDVQKAIAQNLR